MRNYCYGARKPVENKEIIESQLRLANVYQRVLTLIQIRKRAVIDRLYQRACLTEWAAHLLAEDNLERAVAAVRMTRARSGDMLEADEEMKQEERTLAKLAKERLAEARGVAKVAREAWWAARKKATPRLRNRIQMCDRGAYARMKVAYGRAGNLGLAWGTRLKMGESVERAAQSTMTSDARMKMPSFDGSGAIVVQIQKSKPLDETGALACKDTRFRLEVVDARAWHAAQGGDFALSKRGAPLQKADPNSKRSQKKQYALAHLRVGSEGRAPVWATWPVVLHRPLPEGAEIKWVQMHARRVGPRIEWQLLITVDDTFPAQKPDGSTLAVNLGWRTLDDGGLRVAYAVGDDEHVEEVRVPANYPKIVGHVSSLASIRDKMLEAVKGVIVEFRDSEDVEHPEWFAQATQHAGHWRAQRKVARLFREWRERRFEDDEHAFDLVEKWHKQDRHLWFWESDERAKAQRIRKDYYRCVAARWATKYSRVAVTDMDLRDFAEHVPVEEGADSKGRDQRVSQRLAAPSELRGAIKNACATRGCAFEEIEAQYLTQTCHACQVTMAFPAKTFLKNTCTACGKEWDQDFNHATNLLALAGGPSKTPKEKSNRWKVKKDKKKQKCASGEVLSLVLNNDLA